MTRNYIVKTMSSISWRPFSVSYIKFISLNQIYVLKLLFSFYSDDANDDVISGIFYVSWKGILPLECFCLNSN